MSAALPLAPTANPARAIQRVYGLSLPAVAPWAVALFALLILGAVRQTPDLAANWVLGLAVGVVLQRGRLCFAGAFRDLFLMGNGTALRAILAALAVAVPAFALVQAKAVPDPTFGATPAGAHLTPIGPYLVLGGVLFGIGMVVAGGCVSGTLYRLGEGYLASWASLAGILVGLQAVALTWNGWWAPQIQAAPVVWLPATLGYGGAVAASLGLIAAAYLGIMWWESRSAAVAPFVLPPSARVAPAPSTFGQRLAALRGAVLGRGWPVLAAALALAALNVGSTLLDHPLGVTGELAAWADRAAGLVGLAAPSLIGADLLAGCNLVLAKLGLLTPYTLLDGGLVVGSLLAALAAGEFKLRAPRQRRRYAQSLAGGTLMGYGAGIAVGCTIGAFFSAVPSLGLNGWVFGLSLLAGAGVGTQVIRRIA